MKSYFSLLILLLFTYISSAQERVLEAAIPPGKNFDKAEFKMWYTDSVLFKGILVLMPGSNGDARNMVNDSFWQTFARKHNLALLGCRFTDKPHKNMDIEEYINVKEGSGQALLNAISLLSTQSKHSELKQAPLLLWGFSAGGEFNYELTCWKPERVIAFVMNKGGIYYSSLAPDAAREVPGLLVTGSKDLDSRTNAIKGIYEMNRRFGAVWCYANDPLVAHDEGTSPQLAQLFFSKIMALRVVGKAQKDGEIVLQAIPATSGYLGSSQKESYYPATKAGADPNASWLPDTQFAESWLHYIKGFNKLASPEFEK